MPSIETETDHFQCQEKWDSESTLRPDRPFSVSAGNIKVWSEYAKAIFMFHIPDFAANQRTWVAHSKCGYIATLHFDKKQVYKVTLFIPKDELSYLHYLEFSNSNGRR